MDQITVSSPALSVRAEKPLTPAMLSALWEIAAVLDEERVPANVPNSVWLSIPSKRLRGPNARPDNAWLKECLTRMTGLVLTGEFKGNDWGAVMLAEWHLEQGGSLVRVLVPPAGVHALRSPGNFVKIETTAAHRLPHHGRRLYALLADRKRQREPYAQWSIENLRGLMGVDDKRSYDRWNNLRARVIDPALEAINDFGTVDVKMTPVKSGRSVVAVRFDWKWKDPQEASEAVIENDRHSSARRKVQEADDAPPLTDLDDTQRDPAAEWWGQLTDVEREAWKDHVGHFMMDESDQPLRINGKPIARRDRDFAKLGFEAMQNGESPEAVSSKQDADIKTFDAMVIEVPSPEWLLLKLPNKQYAAFWGQGRCGPNMYGVLEGDYESVCAFVGTKKQALKYIADDLANHTPNKELTNA